MVSRSLSDENVDAPVEEALGEVLVRSFSDEKIFYRFRLNERGLISNCTCPKMVTKKVVWKHIYLASRILGHEISFSTGEVASSSTIEEQDAVGDLELTYTERHEEIQYEYDEALATIEPFRKRFNELEDEDREYIKSAVDILRGIGNSLKHRSTESWTGRQHRWFAVRSEISRFKNFTYLETLGISFLLELKKILPKIR